MVLPGISIITACYNASAYIGRCIESVLAQTYSDWELIVVNDGSTDDSLEKCTVYSVADSRIKVYNKENGGVSSARNLGLNEARGQWVTFLDADDTLPVDALEYLTSCVETTDTQLDIVFAGYKVICDGKTSAYPPEKFTGKIAEVLAMELFKPSDYPYQGYVWSKLFRKSIIEKHNLRFDKSIIYNEDRLFTFTYLGNCKQGVYSTHPVYCYYQHPGSAMASIQGSDYWKFETDLDAFAKMCGLVHKFNSSELTDAVRRGAYTSYLRNKQLNKLYGGNDNETAKRLRKKLLSVVPVSIVVSYQISNFMIRCKVRLYNIAVKLRLK